MNKVGNTRSTRCACSFQNPLCTCRPHHHSPNAPGPVLAPTRGDGDSREPAGVGRGWQAPSGGRRVRAAVSATRGGMLHGWLSRMGGWRPPRSTSPVSSWERRSLGPGEHGGAPLAAPLGALFRGNEIAQDLGSLITSEGVGLRKPRPELIRRPAGKEEKEPPGSCEGRLPEETGGVGQPPPWPSETRGVPQPWGRGRVQRVLRGPPAAPPTSGAIHQQAGGGVGTATAPPNKTRGSE